MPDLDWRAALQRLIDYHGADWDALAAHAGVAVHTIRNWLACRSSPLRRHQLALVEAAAELERPVQWSSVCARCGLPAVYRLGASEVARQDGGVWAPPLVPICEECYWDWVAWCGVRLPACCGQRMELHVVEAGGEETSYWRCPVCGREVE